MKWPVQPALTHGRDLWPGCIFLSPLWERGGDADDLARGLNGVLTTATWENGQDGGIDFPGTNGQQVEYAGLLGSPAMGTLMAVVEVDAIDTSGSDFLAIGDNLLVRVESGDNLQGVYRYATDWRSTTSTTSITADGSRHVVLYTCDPASSDQRLYLDGGEIASTTFADAVVYSMGTDTFLGRGGNGDTVHDLDGRVYLAVAWDRVLSVGEIAFLGAFPYAMIEPRGGKLGILARR